MKNSWLEIDQRRIHIIYIMGYLKTENVYFQNFELQKLNWISKTSERTLRNIKLKLMNDKKDKNFEK